MTTKEAERVATAVTTLMRQHPTPPAGPVEFLAMVLVLQRLAASNRPDLWPVICALAASDLIKATRPPAAVPLSVSTALH